MSVIYINCKCILQTISIMIQVNYVYTNVLSIVNVKMFNMRCIFYVSNPYGEYMLYVINFAEKLVFLALDVNF